MTLPEIGVIPGWLQWPLMVDNSPTLERGVTNSQPVEHCRDVYATKRIMNSYLLSIEASGAFFPFPLGAPRQ